MDLNGAMIQILPDLSQLTPCMCSTLCPLLEVIGNLGAMYRWGHPFHLIVQKDNNSLALHTHGQLTGLFAFLEMMEVPIPDWLDLPDRIDGLHLLPLRPQ